MEQNESTELVSNIPLSGILNALYNHATQEHLYNPAYVQITDAKGLIHLFPVQAVGQATSSKEGSVVVFGISLSLNGSLLQSITNE